MRAWIDVPQDVLARGNAWERATHCKQQSSHNGREIIWGPKAVKVFGCLRRDVSDGGSFMRVRGRCLRGDFQTIW
jgi:hypothetical protein